MLFCVGKFKASVQRNARFHISIPRVVFGFTRKRACRRPERYPILIPSLKNEINFLLQFSFSALGARMHAAVKVESLFCPQKKAITLPCSFYSTIKSSSVFNCYRMDGYMHVYWGDTSNTFESLQQTAFTHVHVREWGLRIKVYTNKRLTFEREGVIKVSLFLHCLKRILTAGKSADKKNLENASEKNDSDCEDSWV